MVNTTLRKRSLDSSARRLRKKKNQNYPVLVLDGAKNVLFIVSSISCSVVYIVFVLCCFLVFMKNRCLFEFRKTRASQVKVLSQSESSGQGMA